jgi:hypothetical protein
MMMNIHRATPASFKLIPLANAGVANIVNNPTIIPVNQGFIRFNTSHSPFLMGSN